MCAHAGRSPTVGFQKNAESFVEVQTFRTFESSSAWNPLTASISYIVVDNPLGRLKFFVDTAENGAKQHARCSAAMEELRPSVSVSPASFFLLDDGSQQVGRTVEKTPAVVSFRFLSSCSFSFLLKRAFRLNRCCFTGDLLNGKEASKASIVGSRSIRSVRS